jgi:hydroxyethylthiazole kinase
MKKALNIWKLLQKVRSTNPIIHNMTNYVAMNQTANALLALGASPIMAHALQELPEIIEQSSALVVNIGTLDSVMITSIKVACSAAKQANIPVVLDPVGSGFTTFRTKTVQKFIESGYIDIVRCNPSEAASIINANVHSHGVDSAISSTEVVDLALQIAAKYNITLCITGKKDFVIDPDSKVHTVSNGHPFMRKTTGMGCTASAIAAAFATCTNDHSAACLAAMVVMGICGEKAASQSKGPGFFQAKFLDELYQLDEHTINTYMKLEENA